MEAWELQPSAPIFASRFGMKGTGNGQFIEPLGVAMAKNGNVYVLDTSNNRVEELSPSGTYLEKFGSSGHEKGQLSSAWAIAVDSKGNIWIADSANNRVDEFNEKREFVEAFGFGVTNGEEKLEVCTTTCRAGTAGSGTGQFKEPKGIAVNASGDVYVDDYANNRIEELTEKGAFLGMFGFGVSNGESKFETCTSACKAGVAGSGNGQFSSPHGVAVGPNGNVWVADTGNNRIEEFGEKDEYLTQFGSKGTGSGLFNLPRSVTLDSVGNIWVADTGNNRVQELSPSGVYMTTFGDAGTGSGQFEEPSSIALAPSGAIYVADAKNNSAQEWTPAPRPGNEAAHDTRMAFYSAGEESTVTLCRKHPEWAGLPCQTEPVAQPGVSGSPELPVTTLTYNMWDGIEKNEEKFGSGAKAVTRTKLQTYDPAGRALTSEEASSPATDTALPKVTDGYSSTTGALETQSATINGGTKTTTSKNNSLGQLVEYTDAEGNVTKYTYEEGSDGRLLEVSEGKGKEAASDQTYSYSPTTGFLTKLVDSAEPGMAFTATYDAEGKMTTEGYPNGMTADYTYSQIGTATGIEYIKNTNCSSKCPETWFSNAIVPSIHGEVLQQTSTLAKEKYTYDGGGRLTETQETPAGKGCTARLYAYDEEANRTSLTTRGSATETCATEGGLVRAHSYDSANRLIDGGVEYEAFGNPTKLPSSDANGHELTTKYYVDGQVETQKQSEETESHKLNERTISYKYDPAGRAMETVSENSEPKTKSTVISHYADGSEALMWTSEGSEKWTRNIPGIDGELDATQKSGQAPVLQLHDLEGNIVGTAAFSETETNLLSTYNSTEYGVPTTGSPPPYSWLGAEGVESGLPSSGVSTQGGASYVPEIGRTLQTGPIPSPGDFPNGTAGVGELDPTFTGSASGEINQIEIEHQAAVEKAQALEAEEHTYTCPASCTTEPEPPVGSSPGGGGGSGGGGGKGEGIVILPKPKCTYVDDLYFCSESEASEKASGKIEGKAWDCSLNYGILWSSGRISLQGELTCNVEIKSDNIDGYVGYGSEHASAAEKPGLPSEKGLSYNVQFHLTFKHFHGHPGSTWTEVCWNALTRGGWASGCTDPQTG
jgi:YD repeat-containing protein